MAMSLALLAGTVYLFTMVPKGFLPSEDQGRFSVSTEAMQGIGYDDMVRHQLQVADDRRQGAGRRRFTSIIGRGRRQRRRLNTGRIKVDLKPRDQRTRRSTRSSPAAPEARADSRHPGRS